MRAFGRGVSCNLVTEVSHANRDRGVSCRYELQWKYTPPPAHGGTPAVQAADDRDPMDIMAGLGFERDMAEDLRFHERLLFRYLGWDWPRAWSAPPDA